MHVVIKLHVPSNLIENKLWTIDGQILYDFHTLKV